jgi:hypothetical protein
MFEPYSIRFDGLSTALHRRVWLQPTLLILRSGIGPGALDRRRHVRAVLFVRHVVSALCLHTRSFIPRKYEPQEPALHLRSGASDLSSAVRYWRDLANGGSGWRIRVWRRCVRAQRR